MKMRLYIEADYELADDEQRERVYGSADLGECIKVDEANDPIEMLEGCTVTHHRIRPVTEYSTPGNPAELDNHDLIMATGIHDQDCPCAYCREWKCRKLADFARWVVSLDDPEGPGFEARKAVTMAQIIGKARDALSLPEE